LCDWVSGAGRAVHAIGKIGDIFSMQGISDVRKGIDAELMEHLAGAMEGAGDGSLTFANFVEFDSIYGHRRDVSGYARALEWFDGHVPRILSAMRKGDLVLFTADWCPPCRTLKREVLYTPRVASAIERSAVPVKIDLSQPEPAAEAVAGSFGVSAIPTLVLLSPEGEVLRRGVGVVSAGEIESWLGDAAPDTAEAGSTQAPVSLASPAASGRLDPS